jgi:hypothetical protein
MLTMVARRGLKYRQGAVRERRLWDKYNIELIGAKPSPSTVRPTLSRSRVFCLLIKAGGQCFQASVSKETPDKSRSRLRPAKTLDKSRSRSRPVLPRKHRTTAEGQPFC